MTPNDFRRLALSLPETLEAEHMGHPDFRVAGKIFATLAYPDTSYGMVALTPLDQDRFVEDAPEVFAPVPGSWGRKGATHVHLKKATKAVVKPAIEAAWQNRAPVRLT
ncbi:MAG TPA: MmcQ/YjbR family DNA-binding protein, partial [Pseudacidobacterium sp.]|nr:MmcQ/YjbR family DNA-binding protein [Pseudacidobacterium sp.]